MSSHPSKSPRFQPGFTLIELLIVVAIIAILAAIAVPNFLQAQTRAKVSHVKAEFRTIKTALETYRVDNNSYPHVQDVYAPLLERFSGLTTPISYLTSIPVDPFVREVYDPAIGLAGPYGGINSPEDPTGSLYLYNTSNITFAAGNVNADQTLRSGWSLTSAGPDRVIRFPYYAFSQVFVASGSYLSYIYDPSNGTISNGEIIARGGNVAPSIPQLELN